MDSLLAELSLSKDEDEELILDPVNLGQNPEFSDFCLVGTFLTERTINFNIMKHRLASIWRPGKGVSIHDIGSQRFVFQFFHVVDMRRVLEGGPWTFDNHFLILHQLKLGELPSQVPLFSINFWVQVSDLPIGYMSEGVGKQLGDFIGKFIEYDVNNNSVLWRSYMRIRVAVDVRYPLKRCKKIRKPGGEWFLTNFKYERLGSFCFLCGRLGHTEHFCELLFANPECDAKREWGPWLRASDRASARLGGGKWLRDDNNPQAFDSVPGTPAAVGGSGKEVAKHNSNFLTADNPGRNKAITVDYAQSVTALDSRGTIVEAPKINISHVTFEEEIDGLELADDRKRRRAAQSLGAYTNKMELDTDQQIHFSELENVDPNSSFLSAGPGAQACRQP